uniref:hypothetical protein n=1 Tax=Roseivirga sp. TaxID=1964215 RepID=UPI004047FED4
HNHDGTYEPVFTKNTAFNKVFGTGAGQVAEGNHNHNALYYQKSELNSSGGAGQVHWDRITNKPIAVTDSVAAYDWAFVSGNHHRRSFSVTTTGNYTITGSIRVDSDTGDYLTIRLGTSATAGTGNVVKPRVFKVEDNFESSGDNDWGFTFKLINVPLTTGTTYYMHATMTVTSGSHFIDPDAGDGFEVVRRS